MEVTEQVQDKGQVWAQVGRIVAQILQLDDERHHRTCRSSMPGRCEKCLQIAALERTIDGIRRGVGTEIETLIRGNGGVTERLGELVEALAYIDLYRCHSAPLGQWVVADDTLAAEAARRIWSLVDPLLGEDERTGEWYETVRFMIARYEVSYHQARIERWGIPGQERATARGAAEPV